MRKNVKVPHTLSMPVVSRWFSQYTSLSSLLESKYVLIQLVDAEEVSFNNIPPKTTSTAVLKLIKSEVLLDEIDKEDYILAGGAVIDDIDDGEPL